MMSDLIRIQRALISVSDKASIVDFAKALAAHGVELIVCGWFTPEMEMFGVKQMDH